MGKHYSIALGLVLLAGLLLLPRPAAGQDEFPDLCVDDPGNLTDNCGFDDELSHWHTFVEAGESPSFSVEDEYPACDSPRCPALRLYAEDWFVGGVYQKVSGVVPGATYWANVVWLVYDPAGLLSNTVGRRIGIDPTGGTDPTSSNVVWSQDVWKTFDDCPYKICRELQVQAVAQNSTITLFVRIEDTWKDRPEEFPQIPDHYFDDAESFWVDDVGMILTQDAPTPTPVPSPTPTPTPAPISVTMSSAGGTLTSNDADRSTTIQFPEGAVTSSTVVTYAYFSPLPTSSLAGFDRFFRLDAVQNGRTITRFNSPVTVSVLYPAFNALERQTILLYWLDGSQWVSRGITTTTRSDDALTSVTDHFTLFAVLGDTNRTYLPVFLKSTTP